MQNNSNSVRKWHETPSDSETDSVTEGTELSYQSEGDKDNLGGIEELDLEAQQQASRLRALCDQGAIDVIKTLLEKHHIKADTHVTDRVTLFHYACHIGNPRLIALLLDHGADIYAKTKETERTPLFLACYSGKSEAISLLLERGAVLDLHTKDVNGSTPLHAACSSKHADVIALLLQGEAKYDMWTTTAHGVLPFHRACMSGDWVSVQLLLQHGASVLIQVADKKGRTPLHFACLSMNKELIALLLRHGADRDINRASIASSGLIQDGYTPLDALHVGKEFMLPDEKESFIEAQALLEAHGAKRSEYFIFLEFQEQLAESQAPTMEVEREKSTLPDEIGGALDKIGSDFDQITIEEDKNSEEEQYLMSFYDRCERNNIGAIKEMLETQQIRPGTKGRDGITLFQYACLDGNVALVTLMLKHDADIHAKTLKSKQTPLFLACSSGNVDIVRLLLEEGAFQDIHEKNCTGIHPLLLACAKGNTAIVKLLLEYGAMEDLHEKNNGGATPLHYACATGNDEIILTLLERGATEDLSVQEADGCLPFHIACRDASVRIVEHLFALIPESHLHKEEKYGQTPLHYACSGRNTDVIEYLLQHGALKDINYQSYSGKTPLDVFYNNVSLVSATQEAIEAYIKAEKVLLEYGAKKHRRTESTTAITELLDHLISTVSLGSASVMPVVPYLLSLINTVEQAVYIQDREGKTLLHALCSLEFKEEYGDYISQLLAQDVAKKSLLITDNLGKTPVHNALENRNTKVTNLLFQKGSNSEKLFFIRNVDQFSALEIACALGDVDLVKTMLEKGAYNTFLLWPFPFDIADTIADTQTKQNILHALLQYGVHLSWNNQGQEEGVIFDDTTSEETQSVDTELLDITLDAENLPLVGNGQSATSNWINLDKAITTWTDLWAQIQVPQASITKETWHGWLCTMQIGLKKPVFREQMREEGLDLARIEKLMPLYEAVYRDIVERLPKVESAKALPLAECIDRLWSINYMLQQAAPFRAKLKAFFKIGDANSRLTPFEGAPNIVSSIIAGAAPLVPKELVLRMENYLNNTEPDARSKDNFITEMFNAIDKGTPYRSLSLPHRPESWQQRVQPVQLATKEASLVIAS